MYFKSSREFEEYQKKLRGEIISDSGLSFEKEGGSSDGENP